MKSSGDYISKEIEGEEFVLPSRYVADGFLGAGAFGAVCSARDENLNIAVAIKKCKHVLDSRTLMKRTIREIRLLRLLHHPNIVTVFGIIPILDVTSFAEIYIIFEQMDVDLASVINSTVIVSMGRIELYLWQMLMGLEYMHRANVVHRDLKPRNILVNSDGVLKIADFGLAKQYSQGNQIRVADMTEYATTRWYRAPEVIVGSRTYTKAVDMWAVGCILAGLDPSSVFELLRKVPLFRGKDSGHQLELQCKLMGKPPDTFIRRVRAKKFRHFLENLPSNTTSEPFEVLFVEFHIVVVDVLAGLLQLDPFHRMTASAALEHEFLCHCREFSSRGPNGSRKQQLSPTISVEEFGYEQRPEGADRDFLRAEMLREVVLNLPSPTQGRGLVLETTADVEPALHSARSTGRHITSVAHTHPDYQIMRYNTLVEDVQQLALLSASFSDWSFDRSAEAASDGKQSPIGASRDLLQPAFPQEDVKQSLRSSNDEQQRARLSRVEEEEEASVASSQQQEQKQQQNEPLATVGKQKLQNAAGNDSSPCQQGFSSSSAAASSERFGVSSQQRTLSSCQPTTLQQSTEQSSFEGSSVLSSGTLSAGAGSQRYFHDAAASYQKSHAPPFEPKELRNRRNKSNHLLREPDLIAAAAATQGSDPSPDFGHCSPPETQCDGEEFQMQPWIWWILEGRASLLSPRIVIERSLHRSPSNSLASSASSGNSSGSGSGSLRRCSPALEYVVQYATDVFQQRLQTLAAVRSAIVEEHMLGYPDDLRSLRQIDDAIRLQTLAMAKCNADEANRKFKEAEETK